MYLPASVTLSKRVTDQFRTIKQHTGVNNNVLARVAICLALESGEDVENAARGDAGGQSLDRDLLFGDLVEAFEILIREYMYSNSVKLPLNTAIASLVEIGAHKMGHVRSLSALTKVRAR